MNCVVGNDWLNNSDDDEDIEINSKTIKNILNVDPVIIDDTKKIDSCKTYCKNTVIPSAIENTDETNKLLNMLKVDGKENPNVIESENSYTKEPCNRRLSLINILTKHRSEAINISNVIANCFESEELQNVYKERTKTKIEDSFNSTICAIGEDLFELSSLIDSLLVIPLETKFHVEQEHKCRQSNRTINTKCENKWVKLTVTCALFCIGVSYCVN